MGETTAIAWTDHTFNPWIGCTRVSPGCQHCYAEALTKRTGMAVWGQNGTRTVTSDAFLTPAALLSMNDRLYWRVQRRTAAAWRRAAWVAGNNSQLRGLPPCMVTIELPVADRRRRDPHNYFATVKPVVDGLVDARLWPDDTPEWVTTTEPRLTVGAREVVVHLVARL